MQSRERPYPDFAPHYPGVIAQVEQYDTGGNAWDRHYRAQIYGEVWDFATYHEAVAWCVRQKQLRAEAEVDSNVSAAGYGVAGSLADEIAA